MRVLLDTNVVLDVLLPRPAWAKEASLLWEASRDGRLDGFITATTLTTVFYVARKAKGVDFARQVVRACLDHLVVLTVDTVALEAAYALNGTDFEDDLQLASAMLHPVEAIVTRDGRFPESSIPVYSPQEIASRLEGDGGMT